MSIFIEGKPERRKTLSPMLLGGDQKNGSLLGLRIIFVCIPTTKYIVRHCDKEPVQLPMLLPSADHGNHTNSLKLHDPVLLYADWISGYLLACCLRYCDCCVVLKLQGSGWHTLRRLFLLVASYDTQEIRWQTRKGFILKPLPHSCQCSNLEFMSNRCAQTM